MSLINSTFVIAVHDEILVETGVGREGCYFYEHFIVNEIKCSLYDVCTFYYF